MGDGRAHWFEELADHMGEAYLRYSFTKGTSQEIDFLRAELPMADGCRVLDVGCGPGRHALELARRGHQVVGVDVSETFIDVARSSARDEGLVDATFHVADARDVDHMTAIGVGFDVAICLCQGAFGVMIDDADDGAVLESIAAMVRPGGLLALSAFNAYFSVRHHESASFDVARGVSQESTEVKNSAGHAKAVSLWTGCYTPRELRLVLGRAGFVVRSIYGVEPGVYGAHPPSLDLPEFLVIAERRELARW